MSAAVCGKRLLFEDVHASSSSAASASTSTSTSTSPARKRLRFASAAPFYSRSDSLATLFALFPSMDPQIVERVYDSCDESMDDAIKSLRNLCLEPSENSLSNTTNGEVQGQPCSAPTCNVDTSNNEKKDDFPSDGAGWVEMIVAEMANASDLDDARVRAMRFLEAFEKVVMIKSTETTELLYKENQSLKEQMQKFLQENSILKRAVAIQHERQIEHEERVKELNHLRQLVTQYQEQVRKLELNNYALTIHLKRAEEGSSMPGRFHPDVF